MSTPNYSQFISGIVTRLKEDTRLDAINDDSIHYGGNVPQIVQWPAVTVDLTEVTEEWKTFGGTRRGGKDATCTVVISVYDQQYDYMAGLTSIEGHVENIENVIRGDLGISGTAYYSEAGTKRFSQVLYDNTPVFGAEIILTSKIRFQQS